MAWAKYRHCSGIRHCSGNRHYSCKRHYFACLDYITLVVRIGSERFHGHNIEGNRCYPTSTIEGERQTCYGIQRLAIFFRGIPSSLPSLVKLCASAPPQKVLSWLNMRPDGPLQPIDTEKSYFEKNTKFRPFRVKKPRRSAKQEQQKRATSYRSTRRDF